MTLTQMQQQVREFMKAVGQECPDRPILPKFKVAYLRKDLHREEQAELESAQLDGDIVEIYDALIDLLYVVVGTANAYGLDLEPGWQEVHRSNMSKIHDGHRREDGKWVKGPNYSPANLAPIVQAQIDAAAARDNKP